MFFLKIAKAQHSIDLVKLDRAGGENQTSENEARSFSSKEYEKCWGKDKVGESRTFKLLDKDLFHVVQADKVVSEANKASGSKMPRTDWDVVSEMVFKILNLNEQQEIAAVLTDANKEIELLEQQLADL